MYQVQIWVSEVGEWYGWGNDPQGFDVGTNREAEVAAKRAKRFGWQTRIVKVG